MVTEKLLCSVCLIVFLLIAMDGFCDDNLVTVEDIRPPAFPAFAILGVQPSSTAKNITPEAVTLGILSDPDNLGIPKYALETSPYWLKAHPELKYDKYFQPSIFETLKRTISFSAAVSPIKVKDPKSNEEETKTSFSVGFRFQLFGGVVSPKIKDISEIINDFLGGKIDQETHKKLRELGANELISQIDKINKIGLQPIQPNKSQEEIEAELNAAFDELFKKVPKILSDLASEGDTTKKGFVLEVAAAYGSYPMYIDSAERNSLFGIWLNPSYQLSKGPISQIAFTGGYIGDGDGGNFENFGDSFRYFLDLAFSITFKSAGWEITPNLAVRNIHSTNLTAKNNAWPSISIKHDLSAGLAFLGSIGAKIFKKDNNFKIDPTYSISLSFGFGKPAFSFTE